MRSARSRASTARSPRRTRELNAGITARPAHLFTPAKAYRVTLNTTVRDRIAAAIAATKRLRSFKAQTTSRAKLDSLNAIERTLVTPNVGDPS